MSSSPKLPAEIICPQSPVKSRNTIEKSEKKMKLFTRLENVKSQVKQIPNTAPPKVLDIQIKDLESVKKRLFEGLKSKLPQQAPRKESAISLPPQNSELQNIRTEFDTVTVPFVFNQKVSKEERIEYLWGFFERIIIDHFAPLDVFSTITPDPSSESINTTVQNSKANSICFLKDDENLKYIPTSENSAEIFPFSDNLTLPEPITNSITSHILPQNPFDENSVQDLFEASVNAELPKPVSSALPSPIINLSHVELKGKRTIDDTLACNDLDAVSSPAKKICIQSSNVSVSEMKEIENIPKINSPFSPTKTARSKLEHSSVFSPTLKKQINHDVKYSDKRGTSCSPELLKESDIPKQKLVPFTIKNVSGGFATAYTPVRVTKLSDRETIGHEYVISPVRRSARILTSFTNEEMEKEGMKQVLSVADLFEETGYAYAPNGAL